MKYEVIPRNTDHNIHMNSDDVRCALLEWAKKQSCIKIPDDARISFPSDVSSHKVRIYWDIPVGPDDA